MKRRVLKILFCISVSATMLFGEAAAVLADTTGELELISAETRGAKIVSAYNLADVAGLSYDNITGTLSWNKVAGADAYKVQVYDATGSLLDNKKVNSVYVNVHSDFNRSFTVDAAYTFQVTAMNQGEMYVVAADVTEIPEGLDYDESYSKQITTAEGTKRVYTAYKHPAAINAAKISVIVYPNNTGTVSALSGVTVKEVTDSGVTFSITPGTLQRGEYIQYTYANNAEYRNSASDGLYSVSGTINTDNGVLKEDLTIPFSEFTAGETIYIKAYVYNPEYNYSAVPGQTAENRKSAVVVATYQVPAADVEDVDVVVTNNSIRLEPSGNGKVTGYQYQRKNGKKWEELAQQGDNYTDAGLKGDTRYTYRVRGYIYNKTTKKTSYTAWKTVTATTWGASLNLQAAADGDKAVKLTWAKIDGASGYEVYRIDTNSAGYNISNGQSTEVFSNAKLIKIIKKAKSTKYKDKKLTKGNSYTYMVRAFRTIGNNKCYISDTAAIELSADAMTSVAQYYNTKGEYIVKWNKMAGISGYKVEKYDEQTGKYVGYKTLNKGATTITLPKVAVGAEYDIYRIRPYKDNKVYNGISNIEVYPKLAAVTGVKAVQTEQGVKVSWNKVDGADYYRVYRAKKDSETYNATTKTYTLGNDAELVYEVNCQNTLAGVNLAPIAAPVTNADGTVSYTYDIALGNATTDDGAFYDEASAYKEAEITADFVVDKTVVVPSLIQKSENASYDKNADVEYDKKYAEYVSTFGKFEKNADGSLKTKNITYNNGPEIGTEYYYFVMACAKPSNGVGTNATTTYSTGYGKSAKIVYTNVKTPDAVKLSSVKSNKKAVATIKFQKVSGAKGYAIYRSAKKNGNYVKVGTTGGTSYADKNVTEGKTYYYKVASYKQSENGTFIYSGLSSAKKVKIKK